MSDYLDQMKRFEGYSPRAAWDYKQHTNGYGTRAKFPGETIDRAEAENRFSSEVEKARSFVKGLGVPMSAGQEAALTDLTFNSGTKWAESGLGSAVRKGDWDNASNIFTQYNKAGGETLPGLVTRRQQGASWMKDGGDAMRFAGIGPGGRPNAMSNPGEVYGPQQGPQGAFASLQSKFDQSPLGVMASGLKRGDTTDVQAGAQGTLGTAMGAFGQAASGGGEDRGAAMTKSANEANAAALSAEEQKQMQIIQAMQARRHAGAFA